MAKTFQKDTTEDRGGPVMHVALSWRACLRGTLAAPPLRIFHWEVLKQRHALYNCTCVCPVYHRDFHSESTNYYQPQWSERSQYLHPIYCVPLLFLFFRRLLFSFCAWVPLITLALWTSFSLPSGILCWTKSWCSFVDSASFASHNMVAASGGLSGVYNITDLPWFWRYTDIFKQDPGPCGFQNNNYLIVNYM